MIDQVLNKQFLSNVLNAMEQQTKQASGGRRASTGTDFEQWGTPEKEEALEGISKAKSQLASDTGRAERRGSDEVSLADRKTYMPESLEIANLQAAVEEFLATRKPEAVDTASAGDRRGSSANVTGERLKIWQEDLGDRRIFGPFEQTDIGWITVLFAEGLRLFRKRHEFVRRPVRQDITFRDDKTRMIVFGDWGSGIPRAQAVGKKIREKLDDPSVKDWQKHVIHVGDVYYAGLRSEYEKRFLKYWPVKLEEKDEIGSFTLNGNHDMYSGGHGYYERALGDPRFAAWQGKSSLFQMASPKWQVFGLDTAYEDAGLKDDQAAWVVGAAAPGRKTLLLSHHQYCSSYEARNETLIEKCGQIVKQRNVAAWFWGHEHRCMTFQEVDKIRFPRCVGHAGVPVYQVHGKSDVIPAPGDWEYRDFIASGLEHWAKFGFAILDFKGDAIDVAYVNEDGGVDRTERIE